MYYNNFTKVYVLVNNIINIVFFSLLSTHIRHTIDYNCEVYSPNVQNNLIKCIINGYWRICGIYYARYKLGTHLPTYKAYYYNLLTPPLPGIAVATAIGRTTNGCHVHIPRYNILVGLRAPEDSWSRLNTTYFFPPRYDIVVKSLSHGAGQFRPKWPGGPSKILTDSWRQRWDPDMLPLFFIALIWNVISVFRLVLRRRSRPHNQQRQVEPGPR